MIRAAALRTWLSRAHVNTRALLDRADRLHPLALVVLVALVLALGYGAGTVLVTALVAVVEALAATVKAGAVLAAAALLVRLAYQGAARIPTRRTTRAPEGAAA